MEVLVAVLVLGVVLVLLTQGVRFGLQVSVPGKESIGRASDREAVSS